MTRDIPQDDKRTPGHRFDSFDSPFRRFTLARRAHWDAVAERRADGRGWSGHYHRRLSEIFTSHIAPGQRVLELGCGTGDLLASLNPSIGVGVDFSPRALARAREAHPDLTFIEGDVHSSDWPDAMPQPFDVIVMSDLVNDLWDVQAVLERLARVSHPGTRLVVNFYSRLWEQPLALAQRLGMATRVLPQNWFTVDDLRQLLHLADFETIRHSEEILWPFGTPLVAPIANRLLVRSWPFRMLALTHILVARPNARPPAGAEPVVSVIVPARNEAWNIERVLTETPEMGSGTEIVFVEGHSSDGTYAAIEDAISRHPDRRCRLLRQGGKGKGDAVRLGFERAAGDVLMILDADLTVPPEDLPRFYTALRSGKAEFVNGVRLVYPMEGDAMRFMNLVANKFFSIAFSSVLGQPVKDTLCGTKVLARRDYLRIAANRQYFGDFDPFGDFDLLFGAAKLNLRIVDVPVRYRNRTYGTTNIQRWRHGWLLLRMLVFAARRLKFI